MGVGGCCCRRRRGEGGHAEFADRLLGACAQGGVARGDEHGLQRCEQVDREEALLSVEELADGVDGVRCAGHGAVVGFFLLLASSSSSAAEFAHLGFELAAEEQASRDIPPDTHGFPQSFDGLPHFVGGFVAVDDFFLETLVAVCKACDLGLHIFDDQLRGFGLRFRVCEERDGVLGGQGVDVRVDLLDVE